MPLPPVLRSGLLRSGLSRNGFLLFVVLHRSFFCDIFAIFSFIYVCLGLSLSYYIHLICSR
jgi:hypothetical protein